ncbi:hypothetical protein F4861DRAFT_474268 [Xylaria intraflava]|nr:hypothetical protein F4861DRAFT_474268 [Xylaria intraflava]
MPSAAARRMYEDQIPSFMSIIDPESETIGDRELVTVVEPKFMEMDSSCAPRHIDHKIPQPTQHLRPLPYGPTHRHHDSTSTRNSESTDSSPTLTTDSSSLSDPSPSSSPDSPVNLIPLNSFPSSTFGELPTNMNCLQLDRSTNSTTSFERPMTSPGPRKPRNTKGLSIQPPFATSISNSLVSEPSSPCFIKPKMPGPRKRPSLLSLKTDSQGLNLRPMTLETPSSPSRPPILQRRSLKHSTSSPHMLSTIKSSTFGPAGGMTFPTVFERGTSGLSEVLRPTKLGSVSNDMGSTIMEEDSPIRPQLANWAAMDFEPFHDESEKNEDQKSPGYPDGPIAIYGDSVYLYLEPTAEEASKFDVVINVAREVHNPFVPSATKNEDGAGSGPSPNHNAANVQQVPDTAMTDASFTTAFEYPISDESSSETPTTPKAVPWNEPEYIHMPWDHNTDIGTDLMSLCEMIEKRTKDGKKVLVHCQQGASRSASLIIAYGLYQNPGLSVNDAYYAAQAKSKWISPNMRLMYCLQDFQKEVSKQKQPRLAACPRSGRSPTKHRLTLSADGIGIKAKEPMTAPLPDEKEDVPKGSSPDKSRSTFHTHGNSTSNMEAISPGPSSAPSSFSWSETGENKEPETVTRFNFGDTLAPPPAPYQSKPKPRQKSISPRRSSFFRPPPSPRARNQSSGNEKFGPPDPNMGLKRQNPFGNHDKTSNHRGVNMAPVLPTDDTLMSPRLEKMTNNPLRDSFSVVSGMKFVQSPPTPTEGLFSPRETVFPRNPWFPFGRPPQMADPRSPPTKGETPITRSIDDVL